MITCEKIPNCIDYEDCLLCPARNWLLFRFILIEEGLLNMDRRETLMAAEECVNGSRERDYGTPEDNFAVNGGKTLW